MFCFICSLRFSYLFDEFIIDKDKISYTNSFINYKQKNIKYEDIKEITLKQNFIQRWFELGIISMTTNASIEGAGIDFFNLKSP
ncbi:PH domain-containing protein [Candidatus Tisiphia endosymbiont of Parasteatoda lunata]|uniref:PH domain-containing protein n=1 Tax=Candidatus Tisiphia endosymbiont of Parasteatoda lunata TaxID=3066275 RepID=UPI00313B8B6D